VNQLEKEKQLGKAGHLARQQVHTDAVILDELGYLPFPASGGALLVHLISHLYEKLSLRLKTGLRSGTNPALMTMAGCPAWKRTRNTGTMMSEPCRIPFCPRARTRAAPGSGRFF
jgi:hypothetical protein